MCHTTVMRSTGSFLAQRVAALVHVAMLATVFVVVAVFWTVRPNMVIEPDRNFHRVLRFVALLILVGGGWAIARVRRDIPLQTGETDLDRWWQTNSSRVIVTWAISEGIAISGATVWLLTGDVLVLAAVVVSAIAMLLRLGPSRWVSEDAEISRRGYDRRI